MKIELCPFCGQTGEIIIYSKKRWVKVRCPADNSDNDVEECTVMPETNWCENELEAVRLWNTRHHKSKGE